MVITSGKMDRKTLDGLLEVKRISISSMRDEIYDERIKEAIDENDVNNLDNSYRFKLIEYLNQPVEDYYVLVCY